MLTYYNIVTNDKVFILVEKLWRMSLKDLNISYLTEPGIEIGSPMKIAEDYIRCISIYRKGIEKEYFTKLDLAIFFAQLKANSDCLRISSASGQIVDVTGLEDRSKCYLADKLLIEVAELDDIIYKIVDGLNKINTEKTPKKKDAPAGI